MSANNVKESKADLIKLREMTGAGISDCKKALDEAGGDFEQAKEAIRKRGLDIAKKKAGREAKEGQIFSYIHAGGKLGVLVEINCETDFVARNDNFQEFARDVAMQIAAAHPLYLSQEDIPEDKLAKEKEQYEEAVKGKPAEIQEKILGGKLSKWFEDVCLLQQKFVKDDSQTMQDLLNEQIAKLGENIQIRRFERFEVGGTN